MHCPNCGATIYDDKASACPTCGGALEGQQPFSAAQGAASVEAALRRMMLEQCGEERFSTFRDYVEAYAAVGCTQLFLCQGQELATLASVLAMGAESPREALDFAQATDPASLEADFSAEVLAEGFVRPFVQGLNTQLGIVGTLAADPALKQGLDALFLDDTAEAELTGKLAALYRRSLAGLYVHVQAALRSLQAKCAEGACAGTVSQELQALTQTALAAEEARQAFLRKADGIVKDLARPLLSRIKTLIAEHDPDHLPAYQHMLEQLFLKSWTEDFAAEDGDPDGAIASAWMIVSHPAECPDVPARYRERFQALRDRLARMQEADEGALPAQS